MTKNNTPKRRPNTKRAARAFVATSLAGAAGLAFAGIVGEAEMRGGATSEPFAASWADDDLSSLDSTARIYDMETGATIETREARPDFTGKVATDRWSAVEVTETVEVSTTSGGTRDEQQQPSLFPGAEGVELRSDVAIPKGERPGIITGLTGSVPDGWVVSLTAGCGVEVQPGSDTAPVTVRYWSDAPGAPALDLGAGGVGVEITPVVGTPPANVSCPDLTGAEPAA